MPLSLKSEVTPCLAGAVLPHPITTGFYYKEYRVSNDQVRKSELARKMIEKWAGVPPPDNWESITNVA
jgi:hypothetical protein